MRSGQMEVTPRWFDETQSLFASLGPAGVLETPGRHGLVADRRRRPNGCAGGAAKYPGFSRGRRMRYWEIVQGGLSLRPEGTKPSKAAVAPCASATDRSGAVGGLPAIAGQPRPSPVEPGAR